MVNFGCKYLEFCSDFVQHICTRSKGFLAGVGKTCSLSETCSCSTESYGRDIRLNFFLLCRVSLGEARQGVCTQIFLSGMDWGRLTKVSKSVRAFDLNLFFYSEGFCMGI